MVVPVITEVTIGEQRRRPTGDVAAKAGLGRGGHGLSYLRARPEVGRVREGVGLRKKIVFPFLENAIQC
jgi:hypothetical protein